MPKKSIPIREVIEHLFRVETKTPVNGQRIIPFKLNPTQQLIDESCLHHKMHLILKARQLGCSTYVEARFLAKCMTVEGTHAALVSHERNATARLLRRVHFFLSNLDDSEQVVPREYDNKYELTFPKTHSSFYIGTAGSRAFTRGDMITDFHGSEVAFWPDADKLMAGVMGAVTNDAEVFLESTGNGMGGYFYNLCKEAMEAKEEGKEAEHPYKFHFFPWQLASEYTRKVADGTLWTPEELWLREKYGLGPEQLAWRRWKLRQYPNPETFYQEFPLTPDEAFIVAGTCYFDKTSLRLYYRQAKDPQAVGSVEVVGDEARFFRFENGKTKIWEFPKPMVEYLITVDCSEGVESTETDSSHLQVINRESFSQAASINGKIDPAEMAVQAYAIGKMYKWPWIAVEDNGPGLACLLKLRDLGYPRIYRSKRWDTEKQQETDKLGWHTDMRTRPLILTALRGALRNHTYNVRETEFLQECTTFCRQKDGTYKANDGCHDDRVIANAIAVYLHTVLPYCPEDDYGQGRRDGIPDREITRGWKTGY